MNDAQDEHILAFDPVEDDVVADSEAPKPVMKVVSTTAELREVSEEKESACNRIDQAIGYLGRARTRHIRLDSNQIVDRFGCETMGH